MLRPSGAPAMLAIIAMSMAIVAPFIIRGVPFPSVNSGHDLAFQRLILEGLASNAWRGILPPIWFFDGYAGLGSPAPIFYGPGAFVPALALHRLGIEADPALALSMAAARVVGAIGMFAWLARSGASPAAAVVAAAIMALFPYNALNSPLIAFRYAETMAIGLLPWLFVAADRAMAATGGARAPYVLPIAVLFGAMAMTHLQQTLIAALVLPAWVLLRRGAAPAVLTCLGGVIGAGLAAWLLLPAISMRGLIHEAAWGFSGLMRAMSLFGPWLTGLIFEAEPSRWNTWPFWATLYLGWLLAMGLGMGALLSRVPDAAGRLAAWFTLLLALTMVPPLVWLFPHLPVLVNLQFPWRHMSILGVFAGLTGASLWASGRRPRWFIRCILVVLAGQLAWPWASLAFPPSVVAAHPHLFLQFREDDPAPTIQRPYLGAYEYLPATAIRSRFDWINVMAPPEPLAAICAREPCAELDRSIPGRLRVRLDGNPDGQLLPHFHWPGMTCTGCRLALDERTGLIRAWTSEGGSGTAVIQVAPLRPQLIGMAISGASLLLVAALGLLTLLPRRRINPA